jgi:hypothetical protein
MIVSDVGRTTSGSSSFLPPPCVTTAVSGANPSTCAASLCRKDSGMNRGKYAFLWPVALNMSSSARCIRSQMP